MCPCTFLNIVLTTVETVSHKEMNNKMNNQDVLSECHHTSICDSKRGGRGLASEERVIFVLELLGPILPVHFHRFHRKKSLRSWDKSHQRASSGPLRVSTTKRRNPLHFQSDQILQFPICVLKNLRNCIPAVLLSTQLEDTAVTKTHFQVAGPWGRQPREWPLAWETFLELELCLAPKRAPLTFSS